MTCPILGLEAGEVGLGSRILRASSGTTTHYGLLMETMESRHPRTKEPRRVSCCESLSSINTENRLPRPSAGGCWDTVEMWSELVSSSLVTVLWLSCSFFRGLAWGQHISPYSYCISWISWYLQFTKSLVLVGSWFDYHFIRFSWSGLDPVDFSWFQ